MKWGINVKKEILIRVSVIIAICIATVALVLGYVTVNKLSKINPQEEKTKYSISFDNDSLKETKIGKTITDPKNTSVIGTNFTSVIALKEIGDSVTYTWNIKNNGTVDAVLEKKPKIIGLNDNDMKAIDAIMYINDEEVTEGMEIKAKELATAKIVISYKEDAKTVMDPTSIQFISSTFEFRQK